MDILERIKMIVEEPYNVQVPYATLVNLVATKMRYDYVAQLALNKVLADYTPKTEEEKDNIGLYPFEMFDFEEIEHLTKMCTTPKQKD